MTTASPLTPSATLTTDAIEAGSQQKQQASETRLMLCSRFSRRNDHPANALAGQSICNFDTAEQTYLCQTSK
jgi:hypothetical protein